MTSQVASLSDLAVATVEATEQPRAESLRSDVGLLGSEPSLVQTCSEFQTAAKSTFCRRLAAVELRIDKLLGNLEDGK